INADTKVTVSIYNNMANVYSDLRQYDKALIYYDSLLHISIKSNNQQGQIIALVNKGLVLTDLEKYSEAIKDLSKGLEMARRIDHVYFQSAILNNMGRTYEKMRENRKAIDYYEQAVELAQTTNNKTTIASSMNRLANIFVLEGQHQKAHNYALEALAASVELNSLEGQSDAWKTLSITYDTLANQQQAYDAFKNHIKLKDSILSEENKSEITRKEMQFRMEMQETLDAAEIQRQTTLKNAAIGGLIVLLFASLIAYMLYKRRRDAIEQKKEADFKLNVAETELKALRAQMNPHFIFNSLNSISDYIDKHDINTANEYLIRFSQLMRLTLENSEKESVSLAEDIQWLELYLKLESTRLADKFDYRIVVKEEVDPENTAVPPMILQPFVENSIWHGLANKIGQGQIEIKISMEGQMLLYVIEDDGVGRKAAQNTHGADKKSYGIKITQNRIDILNRLKGEKGEVIMTDKSKGLRVEVRLPLELVY
ncbi:MAG: tetratricopeptide repeat protein, partial [Bacteroidota bacterium]